MMGMINTQEISLCFLFSMGGWARTFYWCIITRQITGFRAGKVELSSPFSNDRVSCFPQSDASYNLSKTCFIVL
jgi:hypothetical protein